MDDFEVLSQDEAKALKSAPLKNSGTPRHPGPLTLSLRAGETAFIPGPSTAKQRSKFYGRLKDYKVHTRAVTRNEVEGFIVWAEPKAK
jgi:hypothetical protein